MTGLLGSFGVALVASLWAYKGWESTTYSAGETKNPQKNLPLGLFIGMAAVIVLYILANLAYLYVLPAGQIATSTRIAADAMSAAIGPIAASIISFIILFSIMGAANANVLSSPRVYYAMAKDGAFFKPMATVHPEIQDPPRRHHRHRPLVASSSASRGRSSSSSPMSSSASGSSSA